MTWNPNSWENINLSWLQDYAHSKTVAEKEILSHGENKTGGLEVVSLACGLVGGETLLPYTPESVGLFISQLTDHENRYQALKFLEELLGKVPIIHWQCLWSPYLLYRETFHQWQILMCKLVYFFCRNY